MGRPRFGCGVGTVQALPEEQSAREVALGPLGHPENCGDLVRQGSCLHGEDGPDWQISGASIRGAGQRETMDHLLTLT